ncbi:Na+/H+ antiporter subunit E [Ferrimonas balearica]|uniref:Na+/H+ antiporter subunit E n=2 Tax=Ferrimonas balearica TaxID=44012 RepID=UPI0031BBA8C2
MMRPLVSLALFLLLLWLSNSGHYGPLLLGLGTVSIVLVLWLSARMGMYAKPMPLRLSKLPRYWLWLMSEVVRANIQVVRHIWRGYRSISPGVARLPLPQKYDVTRVVYANSITLTPGTVTLRIDGDTIEVHALNAASLDELAEGEMSRRVLALES